MGNKGAWIGWLVRGAVGGGGAVLLLAGCSAMPPATPGWSMPGLPAYAPPPGYYQTYYPSPRYVAPAPVYTPPAPAPYAYSPPSSGWSPVARAYADPPRPDPPLRPVPPPSADAADCVGWWRICHFF